jgi:hypothetical protein
MLHVEQQARQLFFDDAIALANLGLQSGPVKHRYVAAAVTNKTGTLQIPGGLGYAFPAHAERAGDELLRDDQFIRRHTIKRQ